MTARERLEQILSGPCWHMGVQYPRGPSDPLSTVQRRACLLCLAEQLGRALEEVDKLRSTPPK